MKKYTQRQLKNLVSSGVAIDLTYSKDQTDLPESYKQVGYVSSAYGCNGKLLQGLESGQLYAITSRTSAIYIY